MKPAVSVVIPLYNKAPYIERSVQSVLQQTFKDFEVIVVDDGSTDGGGNIVQHIADPRIHLIRQENAGVSAARNRGIMRAKAELVAFLDADDEWKPQFLETIQRLRKKFPEAGAYATAYEIWEPDGTTVLPRFKGIPDPPWEGIIPNFFQAGLGQEPVWSSAVAVPKLVFEDVGGFPVGIAHGEDLDTWLRIALRYPVAFSYTYQAVYHQEATNRAALRHFHQPGLLLVKTARLAVERGKVPSHLQGDLLEYLAKYQIDAGARCVKAGNPTEARRILATCRNTKKFRYKWLWWFFLAMMPRSVSQLAWRTKRTLASLQKRMQSRPLYSK